MTDELPDHLVPNYSLRGFPHLPPLPASYDYDEDDRRVCGGAVRVYASSAATHEPSVWLAVDAPFDRNDPTSATFEATVHLSAATVRQLVDQLRWLVGDDR